MITYIIIAAIFIIGLVIAFLIFAAYILGYDDAITEVADSSDKVLNPKKYSTKPDWKEEEWGE